MKKMAKTVLLFTYLVSCLLAVVCISEAGNKDLRKLYGELMVFKDDAKFHEVGFGTCCEYHKCQSRVKVLRDDPRLTLSEKVAAGDLLTLGLEYMKTKGKENNYTQFANESIKEVLEE